MFQDFIIKPSDNFSGFHGELHFFSNVNMVCIYEKPKTVILFRQVLQFYYFRAFPRLELIHVVDLKFLKIGDNDPTGFFV